MMTIEEKCKSCIHYDGRIGEFIVYVKPSCPHMGKINGTLVVSKLDCRDCRIWEKSRKGC